MISGKTMRVTAAATAAAAVMSVASPAFAANSILLSALLPGLGQAQQGHYTKATIFGTAAIASWIGVFASQINYSRSVDTYNDQKRIYLAYGDQLKSGTIVKGSDIDATYQAMSDAYNKADDEAKWRDIFVGAVVVTYALNLVDIILSRPDTGEVKEPATSLEVQHDGFRLVRTIRF
ncbi:MAG TPA: DUF5683 domain-containing protein [Candidatus Krumholzibacteria bacterium]|nr:DUF5683 domain-containing protein [Candidatus Krumholzibacteria bacterium]